MHPAQSIASCTLTPRGGSKLVSFVLRPDSGHDNSNVETLVIVGDEFCGLHGAESLARGAFSLSEALDLLLAPALDGQPWPTSELSGRHAQPATWDAWSGSTYFVYRNTVLRLAGEEVSLVAGHKDEKGQADGNGEEARFSCEWIGQLASAGDGTLYYIDGKKIRRIQLPAAWRAAAPAPGAGAAAGGAEPGAAAAAVGSGRGDGRGGGGRAGGGARRPLAAASAAEGQDAAQGARAVEVSTLPYTAPEVLFSLAVVPAASSSGGVETSGGGGSGEHITAQVRTRSAASATSGRDEATCEPGSGACLVFGTNTALYRLPLPLPGAAGAAAGPAAAATLRPEVLAGMEGRKGLVDGRGREARLGLFSGITIDAARNIYLVDNYMRGRVRRVAPDGSVLTLVTDLQDEYWWPAILPNGYLALGSSKGKARLLDMGLQPLLPQLPGQAAAAAAAAAAAGATPAAGAAAPALPRSLPSDLGALLDADGADGTSDLTIRVGERRFHVHRGILSARCDYFKQRLAAGAFADANAAELDLPDADPDAFAPLLRWMYTGAADVVPEQARAVAELADRLLLPELCGAALGVVAAAVSGANVVDALLWAEACCEARGGGGAGGSAFERLRQRLKCWYLANHQQVAAEAGPSRKRLAEAPSLMLELMDAALQGEPRQGEPRQQGRRGRRRG